MTHVPSSPALARALRLDAAASGAMGLLLAVGAPALQPMFGLPTSLLRAVGVFLLPFAVALLLLAPRANRALGPVRLIIAGNLLWIAASVVVVVATRGTITLLGEAFVLGQAAAVALFVYLEARALRGATALRARGELVS
jgi:Na+/melibiose symporter-like transporter